MSMTEVTVTNNSFHVFVFILADYPLGRVGSCLRPGMVRRPVSP